MNLPSGIEVLNQSSDTLLTRPLLIVMHPYFPFYHANQYTPLEEYYFVAGSSKKYQRLLEEQFNKHSGAILFIEEDLHAAETIARINTLSFVNTNYMMKTPPEQNLADVLTWEQFAGFLTQFKMPISISGGFWKGNLDYLLAKTSDTNAHWYGCFGDLVIHLNLQNIPLAVIDALTFNECPYYVM
ncbi:MAG: hypothetical protein WC916_01065 [Candidatus Woesearchaeota archaeon]